MANFLEQYREAFPEFRETDDAQLTDLLYEKYGTKDTDKADFALGLKGRGPRVGPFKAGIESLKGSGEVLAARVAQALGAEDTAQKYLKSSQEREQEMADRYQPETRGFEDVDSAYKFGRYLYERFGESAPQMLLQVGGGVAGLAARGAVGAMGLAAAKGLSYEAAATIGSTIAGAGAYTGSNIQRQMEEGTPFKETSLGAAGAAALGQGALDTLSLRTIFKGVSAPVAGSRLTAAVTRGLESGATEALTETGQQALEILQANPGKLFSFSEEVQKELKEAAIAGGLLGGALGGASGAIGYRKGVTPEPKKEGAVSPKMGAEAPVGEAEPGAVVETPAGEPAVTETPAAATTEPGATTEPVAAEPPVETAPAPRIAPEPAATVEPGTTVEPGATVEPTATTEPGVTTTPVTTTPVTTEPAAAPTAQGPAPTAVEPVTPAPEPKAPVEAGSIFDIPNPPALPKPLQLGTPKFDQFRLNFERDVDRALFHASKKDLKPKDLEYFNWLKDQGLSDRQITSLGQQYRQILREGYREKIKSGVKTGPWTPPQFTMKLRPLKPEAPVAPSARPVQTAPGAIAESPIPAASEPATPPVEQAPPTTVQAQPAPPPPQTAPFTRDPSTFQIAPKFEQELEGYLPGIGGVLREIQQNLFPGTELRVTRSAERARHRGKMTTFIGGRNANNMVMRLNVDALKSEFGGKPEAFKAKLLHTIFHEMAHPVEYFYVANANNETLSAILQQYVKERNPNSMQRSMLVKGLIETRKGGDLGPVLDRMLKATGLSKKQYDAFLASESKTTGDALVRKQEFASRYQRSFSEWVAEKGAEFYTKNLDQLVPKNVFEKFQKDILELLRDLYSRIAKFLGMPETEGAFERLMKDKYGKVKRTPTATVAALELLQLRPEYIKSKGRALDAGAQAVVSSEEAAPTEAPANVASATQKLANVYTKPESMGFKGFIKAIKDAYTSGLNKELGDKITRAVSDRFIDLKRLDERFVAHLKATGQAIQAAYDNRYAIAANLSSYAGILSRENVLGMLETVLKYGGVPIIKKFSGDPLDGVLMISRDNNKVGLNFLQTLMQEQKLDAFKYYAMAKRVLGRYSTLEAPITIEEAQAIVDHYGKDATVTKAYEDYQNFNKALMQMAVDSGVISQKIAKEFMKHNDYYPFYREMDETGRYTGPLFTQGVMTKTKIQQATGGTGQLEADPIEVIMKNAQFWMHSAAKNLAARKIYTMMKAVEEASDIKHSNQLKPGESEGEFRVDGKPQKFAIKNPDIAAALETTGAHQLPNWTKFPGKFTQFYRELVTRSPDFILKNLIRDPLSAMVTSGVDFNPFGAMANFGKVLTGKETQKELLALQNYGIIGGFRTIPGTESAKDILNANFKPTSNGLYVVPDGGTLTKVLAKAWNALGAMSEASDAATRMEIYKRVLEATGNEAEAAFRAQEVINWRKQGNSSIIRYASILVPFVNGRIQGLDVTARAFAPKNLPYTMLKGGYLFAVSMALQAMFGDDDEYKQLPDYVRHGSTPIPLKALGLGDTGFLVIPKPFEIGFVFQTVPEVIVQSMLGNTENRDLKKVVLEQLANTFGLAMAPQVVLPVFEQLMNRSSLTGLPIVTEAQKNLPADLQYTSATSDIVKSVAGSMGISPVRAEALIKGYGGQIVTSMLGIVDGMYRSATGTGVDKDWTQYPTISTFLKTAQNTNPKGASDVYRLSAEIQGLTTAINTYVAQGMGEKALELVKENEGLLSMKNAVTGLRTQLNTLSRNERMIVNNPNISQDQKELQVDQIREARRTIGKAMTSVISRTEK